MRSRLLILSLALHAVLPARANEVDPFARAVPSAGADSTTLVVYDTLAKPFSMINEVSVISTLLGRFATRIEMRQADAVSVADVEKADYLVVAGIADVPRLSEAVRETFDKSARPVAYVGWASRSALPGRGPAMRAQSLPDARIDYAGSQFTTDLDPFFAIGTVPAEPLAVVVSPAPRRYLAWRDGMKFAFASLPTPGAGSLIFSDLLLDFYGVKDTPPATLVYLVQDFHPGCDAGAFRRLVDYFAARGDRFAVSVRLQPPRTGSAAMADEQFFDALRYAQSHGGRVVLRPETSAAQVRRLVDAGLVPLACELPAGAKRPTRPLQGISFGTALGRIEAPGPKGSTQPVSASAVMAGNGSALVIPLNIDPAYASTHERGIAVEVGELARLRGTVAGVVIPAWYPFQKMRDAVDDARRSGLRGADLSSAPNWIKTDQAIITGKNVRRAFSVPAGHAGERVAFDRNFQPIGEAGGETAVATAILLPKDR